MNDKKHIIEKVLVDVNTNNLETANSIKNNIDVFLKDEVFPKIEELLDKYSSQQSVIRFNKIEIVLKAVQETKNLIRYKFEILKQFEEQLKNIESNSLLSEDSIFLQQKDKKFRNIISRENYEDIFLFFIKNGFYPWFGSNRQIKEFTENEIWKESFNDKIFIQKLEKIVLENKRAIQRFVYQFPLLIYTFLAQINLRLNEAITHIQVNKDLFHPLTETKFLSVLFFISVEKSNTKIISEIETWLNYIEKNNNSENQISISELNKILLKIIPEELINTTAFHDPLNRLLSFVKNDNTFSVKTIKNDFTEKDLIENSHDFFSQNSIIEENKKAQDQELAEESFFDETINEIRIENAGLVIVHPFLNHFFSILKIVNKESIIKPEKKDLAVQVLHYLATGEENAFEGDLVFEKFLCGVPLTMPIVKKSILDDETKREADNLLSEVIKNWPALKNTSPVGLQQMFLQRNGKLIFENEKYKCIVERKAQDVLLEKLNWNISFIKLPWHKELLQIEW